ncbi:alpha/beta hydrolase [Pedobacter frigiditerrae]|uniref:Alpha/beta hydrolase n=2 Tax=Pedobacter frigiditerrae TaxID=2530452 RepID=A0A4R0MPN8_9SPHI|nr:alpha/beta hydrolase [Pedobacter frigiditerrae]
MALFVCCHTAKSQTNTEANTSSTSVTTIQRVTFPNRNVILVGNLYLPKAFDKNKKYPTILVGHPAGGVKEQTAGLYAQKLAEQGYIALAFDASYQGESGGEPRFLEDPAVRVEDFRAATDYLSIHPSVDPTKIGLLGICAGGGFAIKAAETEHRLKAVATISMADLGQLRRDGLNGTMKAQVQQRLDDVAKQRTKEANGGEIRYMNYVPNSLQDIPANAPVMYQEGYEYYRTKRGQHPNSTNKYLFTSLDKLIGFTALDHVELISPRPLLLIAGSIADTYYYSQQAYAQAQEPKELYTIEGATHVALYDTPEYVSQIVKKLTIFYGKNL